MVLVEPIDKYLFKTNTFSRFFFKCNNKLKFAPCENKLLYSYIVSIFRFIQWLFEQSENAVTETTRSGLCSAFVTIIHPFRNYMAVINDSLTMWRVLYTEQDIPTHPKHLMSILVFMGVHIASALVFCVCDVLVFFGVPCLCSFVFCPLFISFLPYLWTVIHVIIRSLVPSVFYCHCFLEDIQFCESNSFPFFLFFFKWNYNWQRIFIK